MSDILKEDWRDDVPEPGQWIMVDGTYTVYKFIKNTDPVWEVMLPNHLHGTEIRNIVRRKWKAIVNASEIRLRAKVDELEKYISLSVMNNKIDKITNDINEVKEVLNKISSMSRISS